ncbi:PAS domain S-box-containing protein/diguanylate cyclase (GGDEF) domain-containing protein [Streptomyces sp. TLI_053]|uniref:putative bifunctional diguanylate cyclase/phosphodiesterase n=1 Tax=Streptomyces sp. TLI_053 TaxID=1855352 RepID=UPI00087A5AB1|nr:GGDEF domain-containing phosphodiesterase [Streptomyces sp. TLI_053]SDT76039.1 PAS domain S-box-containing protein/diguanylate cyclase (GGDEF) domain-containing protein [Streptomyces sp. TLI_053]
MPGQNEGADAHHPGVRHGEPRAQHRLAPPAARPVGGGVTNGTNGTVAGATAGTTQAVLDAVTGDAPLCPTCSRPLSDDTHRTADGDPGTGTPEPGAATAEDGNPLPTDLRVSEARLRAAFWDAGIGMALIDPEDRIIEVNPAFAALTGRTVGELAQTHIHEIVDPEGMPHRLFPALVHGERDRLRIEKQLKHREGRTVWSKVTVSLIRDAAGGPLYTLALVEDITEQRRLGDRLEYQALHDPLTRLPNRTYFFERLDAACLTADRSTGPLPAPPPPAAAEGDGDGTDGPRVGVCYLDLDGFAAINETLGHHIGDQLLIAVATRLRRGFSAHGTRMVARMGGDEFAVLVTDSRGSDQLTDLAARILEALERPFDVAGHRLVVTASVGVVERSVQETTPTDLVKDADATLYWSKADGRARWTLYDPDRGAHQLTRQLLATALRPALERGEFTIEYQPLVGLADGAVHGAEALVRWRHPRYGTLSPDRFIPLAEESGAIVPLGKWVLEESCRQARRWLTEFPETETFVSVNLAARQIWDSDVVADVAQALERTGLPARLLQLEITESALLGPGGRPLQALQALADMGVRIAIDDFGTGYSNLAYLSRLPVHVLKLDGTFIEGFRDPSPTGSRAELPGSGARRSDADEQIVGAMVQLAHTLGLTVTAEGIESAAQAERLRLTGCDTAQGWYFARPGEAELVAAILRDNRDGRAARARRDDRENRGGRDGGGAHRSVGAGPDGREAPAARVARG